MTKINLYPLMKHKMKNDAKLDNLFLDVNVKFPSKLYRNLFIILFIIVVVLSGTLAVTFKSVRELKVEMHFLKLMYQNNTQSSLRVESFDPSNQMEIGDDRRVGNVTLIMPNDRIISNQSTYTNNKIKGRVNNFLDVTKSRKLKALLFSVSKKQSIRRFSRLTQKKATADGDSSDDVLSTWNDSHATRLERATRDIKELSKTEETKEEQDEKDEKEQTEGKVSQFRKNERRYKKSRKSRRGHKRNHNQARPLVATFVGAKPDLLNAAFIGPWVKMENKKYKLYDFKKFHLVENNMAIEVGTSGLYMISVQIYYSGDMNHYSFLLVLNSEGSPRNQTLVSCATVSLKKEVSCYTNIITHLQKYDRLSVQQQETER
ncbi:hypothetical protein PUN28_019099 [Cardiocondyla obscurior]